MEQWENAVKVKTNKTRLRACRGVIKLQTCAGAVQTIWLKDPVSQSTDLIIQKDLSLFVCIAMKHHLKAAHYGDGFALWN